MTTPSPTTTPAKPVLNNGLYNTLKWIAQIFLPALGTLYFALAGIWSLGHAQQVVGTITAVDFFLGALLSLATKQYINSGAAYDGTIDVLQTDTAKQFQLNFDQDPYDLDQKDSVTLKVNGATSPPLPGMPVSANPDVDTTTV